MRARRKTEKEHYQDMLTELGKRLTILRIRQGFRSQEDFTAKHRLPPARYRQIENGTARVTLKFLHKLLTIHGMTLGEFLDNV